MSARAATAGGGGFIRWVFRLTLLCVVYVMFSAGVTWHFVVGYKGGMSLDPRARGIDATEVSWQNERRQTIRAIFAATPGRPCVVLAHGHRANRGQLAVLFSALYQHCRLGVLAFDFRGSGESDGWFTGSGAMETPDLVGALDFLREQGYQNSDVGVVAFDTGVIAALGAAPRLDELGAVVLIGGAEGPRRMLERRVESYGLPVHPTATLAFALSETLAAVQFDRLDTAKAWTKLEHVAVMLMGGTEDTLCPPSAVEAAFERIPSKEKVLALMAGRGHDDLLSSEAPEVRDRITRFLLDRLGE